MNVVARTKDGALVRLDPGGGARVAAYPADLRLVLAATSDGFVVATEDGEIARYAGDKRVAHVKLDADFSAVSAPGAVVACCARGTLYVLDAALKVQQKRAIPAGAVANDGETIAFSDGRVHVGESALLPLPGPPDELRAGAHVAALVDGALFVYGEERPVALPLAFACADQDKWVARDGVVYRMTASGGLAETDWEVHPDCEAVASDGAYVYTLKGGELGVWVISGAILRRPKPLRIDATMLKTVG